MATQRHVLAYALIKRQATFFMSHRTFVFKHQMGYEKTYIKQDMKKLAYLFISA